MLKRILYSLIIVGLSAPLVFGANGDIPDNFSTDKLKNTLPFFCPLPKKTAQPKGLASLDSFKKISILDNGRIKPLDTYAQNLLLQFSGRRTFEKSPAIHWLAKLLFSPNTTMGDKIFLINNPDIVMAGGIGLEEKRRYSFIQLQPGLSKFLKLFQAATEIDEKDRDTVEGEIIRVYQNLILYDQYFNVLNYAYFNPELQVSERQILDDLGIPKEQVGLTLLDVALKADLIQKRIEHLDRAQEQEWTDQEKTYFNLLNNFYQWSFYNRNLPFDVIPTMSKNDENWLSPWNALANEFTHQTIQKEITIWKNLVVYYWNGDQLSFDMSVNSLRHSVTNRASDSQKEKIRKGSLELIYNHFHLLLWAKLLYGAALVLFLLSMFFDPNILRKGALTFIGIGFVGHLTAIIMRMVIMARPPVTSLYETFIFVSLVGVLSGLLIERVNKRWLGIATASILGVALLMIAQKYSMEGETMGVLIAVLNSNFWLSTHVLSISTGYAGVCIAGIIGHMYILQRLFKPKDQALREATFRINIGTLGFGLMMTFLGTVLGGIWADDSWGRFWGWDPKENGALMIILWCAICFHAKIAKWIGPLGFAVVSSLGIIVVLWAWFGVNLLGVGLHSYGFTSGVAHGLLIYVICECVFLMVALTLISRKLITP